MAQNIIFAATTEEVRADVENASETKTTTTKTTTTTTNAVERKAEDEEETDEEELERSLLSYEQFDNRSSPDLWPDQIPGVSDFVALQTSNDVKGSSGDVNLTRLENHDGELLRELGSLENMTALMERVRSLQNAAYELGLEEAKEMTRGKFLNILSKPKQ